MAHKSDFMQSVLNIVQIERARIYIDKRKTGYRVKIRFAASKDIDITIKKHIEQLPCVEKVESINYQYLHYGRLTEICIFTTKRIKDIEINLPKVKKQKKISKKRVLQVT